MPLRDKQPSKVVFHILPQELFEFMLCHSQLYLDVKRSKYFWEFLKQLVHERNLDVLSGLFKSIRDALLKGGGSGYDFKYFVTIVESILLTCQHLMQEPSSTR